jgi:formylmethanofuran dehydrogenase subunit B
MFVLTEAGGAVAGRAVPLPEAITAAAALLAAAACPVLGGLCTDDAGARAAAALARRLDAVLDHAESAPLLRDLGVMQDRGAIRTTPAEARARADLVLLAGDCPADPPAFWRVLALDRPPTLAPAGAPARQVIRLGAAELPGMLGPLAAAVAGRPVAAPEDRIAALAATLRGARYAVVVWSAARLDALAIEALQGLIEALNATTRCAGLPLPPAGNAAGVAQALAASTGFPCRVGFRDGMPRYDPWRYDAARMVAAGEADAALWLDALGEGAPPAWPGAPKLVVLAPPGTRLDAAPAVAIAVGRPGVDHPAALVCPATAALRAVTPAAPTSLPTAAALLGQILAALPC